MARPKKSPSDTPIDLEIMADLKKQAKKKSKKSTKSTNKKKLIEKYGLTGIEKNSIPVELQAKETIKKLEQTVKDLKKYGNPEVFEFIPSEVAQEVTDMKDYLDYLGSKSNRFEVFVESKRNYIAIPDSMYYCVKCGQYKVGNFFYKNSSYANGVVPFCKDCLMEMGRSFYKKYDSLEKTLILMCLYTNTIYHKDTADLAIKNMMLKEDDPGMMYHYYRVECEVSGIFSNFSKNGQTFETSNFDGNIFKFVTPGEKTPVAFFPDQNEGKSIEMKKTEENDLKNKWGAGFTTDEYNRMEKLFNELAKFKSKKNVIQTNALIEYVRLKIKLDNAVGKGDLKEIEKWQKLTDSAAKNAGVRLDQLTAEDMGEGLDSWTTLVELVEEYDSVIPIMPKMKKMPYDDIDFIIWEVVNYCRRLMELPEVDYKDVWNYIDERFLEEMKRRGYTERQIEKEKEQRHAIFKELGDNYIEPLWLNPNLQEEEGEEEDV